MVSCNWFCNPRKTDSFYFWRYVLVYGRWWDTGEKGPKESDKKWGWVNLQCPPYLPLFSVPLYLPWWYSHGIEFRTLPTKQNNTWPNPPDLPTTYPPDPTYHPIHLAYLLGMAMRMRISASISALSDNIALYLTYVYASMRIAKNICKAIPTTYPPDLAVSPA